MYDPTLLKYALLYETTLDRADSMLDRMLMARNAIITIANDSDLLCMDAVTCAVIEGASFGARYRQVELAEQRAVIALWFHEQGIEIKVKPPQSVRLQAFGSAKIKAKELWPDLPPNAVAALGCVLSEACHDK